MNYSKTPDEHPPHQQHPLLSITFSRHRLFFHYMIYKSTPDEQHPSNATSNSILVNKMAKVPLISNTFMGVAWGAWGAFLVQSLGLLQTSGQSRTCLALASANEQLPPCGAVQVMFGLVFWLLVLHKCRRAELVAWHAWGQWGGKSLRQEF